MPKLTGRLDPWNDEDPTSSLEFSVFVQGDAINVVFENETKIWIEREGGRVRVHCFDPIQDEPTTLELYDETHPAS